jgi:hypothetical protein
MNILEFPSCTGRDKPWSRLERGPLVEEQNVEEEGNE